MNKKLIVRSLCLILLMFFLSGCDNSRENKQTDTVTKVGILKFIRHPALDSTEQGLIDRINKHNESGNITIIQEVADGDARSASSLAQTLIARGCDIIVPLATPAAQAIAELKQNKADIVYGAVSDPEGAGLIPSKNTTGIKNVGPKIINNAIDFIVDWHGEDVSIGTVYNPSEQNSVYVQNIITNVTDERNIKLNKVEARKSNNVASSVATLTEQTDVIYSANDNTFNSAISSAADVCAEKKTPLFIGDLNSLKSGGIAAIGLNYYKMGKDLGDIILRLHNGTEISKIEPSGPPDPEVWVNLKWARKVGLKVPKRILNKADNQIK